MQDTYTFPVDLSLGDWYNLSLVLLPRTKAIRRVFFLITGINLLVSLPLILSGEGFHLKDLLTSLAGPAFFLAFISVGMLFTGIYLDKYNPAMLRGSVYRFNHWGMEFTGLPRNVSIPWRQFYQLKETKSFLLLYHKENNAVGIHVIQKKVFADEAATQEFRQFIRQNLSLAP